MSKGRILVVEDDFDIANMLRIYFSGQGFEVQVAPRGGDALAMTRKQLPELIVLDIMLPDMNGYDVCKELRQTTRTSHIPIIFLTQKDERSDKLIGLELGADDYITKPFDIEELKLRVQNSISAARKIAQFDDKSNLPTGRLIEEHLRQLMRSDKTWSYLDLKLNHYADFQEVYGFSAADDVIRFVALVMSEAVEEFGSTEDFLGHPARDNFVIITHGANVDALRDRIVARFNDEVRHHYSFIDRERGYILVPDGVDGERKAALMTMAVGAVSTETHQFSDIREITELAAENRRRGFSGEDTGSKILTEW
jgi:PleD family two-component response regulator